MPGRASWLCTDPMLMILPLPRSTMPRATRCLTRNALVKLVATRSFQSCKRELDERRTALDAGVVDQDVGRSPLLLDVGDSAVDGVLIGDIERADPGLTAGLLASRAAVVSTCVDVATVDGDPGCRPGASPWRGRVRYLGWTQ